MKTETISERFYNHGQSWVYERTVRVQGITFRATICRNSYDDQSYLRSHIFDDNACQWNLIVWMPIEGAACADTSYVQPEERAGREYFEKDADVVLDEAYAIRGLKAVY